MNNQVANLINRIPRGKWIVAEFRSGEVTHIWGRLFDSKQDADSSIDAKPMIYKGEDKSIEGTYEN